MISFLRNSVPRASLADSLASISPPCLSMRSLEWRGVPCSKTDSVAGRWKDDCSEPAEYKGTLCRNGTGELRKVRHVGRRQVRTVHGLFVSREEVRNQGRLPVQAEARNGPGDGNKQAGPSALHPGLRAFHSDVRFRQGRKVRQEIPRTLASRTLRLCPGEGHSRDVRRGGLPLRKSTRKRSSAGHSPTASPAPR